MNMQPVLLSLLFWQNCAHFKIRLFTECAYHFPSSSSVEAKTDLEQNRSGQNRSWTARSGVGSFYFAGLDSTISKSVNFLNTRHGIAQAGMVVSVVQPLPQASERWLHLCFHSEIFCGLGVSCFIPFTVSLPEITMLGIVELHASVTYSSGAISCTNPQILLPDLAPSVSCLGSKPGFLLCYMKPEAAVQDSALAPENWAGPPLLGAVHRGADLELQALSNFRHTAITD